MYFERGVNNIFSHRVGTHQVPSSYWSLLVVFGFLASPDSRCHILEPKLGLLPLAFLALLAFQFSALASSTFADLSLYS
jgi:hypothetical protein